MTEFEGLYTAVVESGPKEIERNLAKIPGIHQQEALDSALEKSISLSLDPKVQNVRFLLKLGADPNGPSGDEGVVLCYAYSSGLAHIVELLLQAGADVNAIHSNVLEQAVRKGDIKYVVRFVEAGADINDKSRLLFTDDLLLAAKNSPEIQQYLISKGIPAPVGDLNKKLANVNIPKLSDFDYPDPGYKSGEHKDFSKLEQIYSQDYSTRHFVVRGNTKEHQELLRKNGGRFFPKLRGGRGWLLPLERRTIIEAEMANLTAPVISPEQSPEDPETPVRASPLIKNVVAASSITRPIIKNSSTIDVYTPIGKYGYMTIAYTRPQLFYLDGYHWDSIERYLMYKMYQGSFKAKAIRDADTLIEARKKFNVNTVSTAKTPKQLVVNQKLQPLARSEMNNGYLQHREQLFYRANKEKFAQNKFLLNRLLNTNDKEIVNKNSHDIFGYEGNLLGNTLMKLRHEFGGPDHDRRNVSKTSSLIIEKYPSNKNFYVIRGDPNPELAAQIRNIGTFKTKTGKVIRGKLNLNLQGGAGWLIPHGKHEEAKTLVFDTYPDEKKLEISGRTWVEKRMKQFLDVAILFSQFRNRQEVGSDDLLFTIKDVFGGEDFLGEEKVVPSDHFIRSVWKYVEKQDAVISDAAIQLLWDFLSKMVLEFTQGIETYQQMNEIMTRIDATILDTAIKSTEGLTERESIVVHSFGRLYKLLKKINDSEAKICVTVVHMMLGKYHYENIREIYSKKAKMQGDAEYPDDEIQFRRRFHIKNPHIQAVLDNLPKNISKKCRLLILTTLDYVMSLEGEDAITISKHLIILSQKGKQPSPTPKSLTPVEENSDIPKLADPDAEHDKTPNNEEHSPQRSE